MASVGKSILNTAKKAISKKATKKQNEIKTIKFHKLPLRFVQPHMPVKKVALTEKMKNEIQNELNTFRTHLNSAPPEQMFNIFDTSLESFFHKREFTLENFNSLLQILSHQGKIDESLGIIEKMKIMGIVPNLTSYIHLITASGRAKDSETSELIFSKAKKDLDETPAVLYSSLISSYVHSGNHEAILRLINEKQDKGFEKSEVDYTCYMNSLIKAGQADKALEVYKNTIPLVNIDEYMMAMAIHACTKTNDAEYALTV